MWGWSKKLRGSQEDDDPKEEDNLENEDDPQIKKDNKMKNKLGLSCAKLRPVWASYKLSYSLLKLFRVGSVGV